MTGASREAEEILDVDLVAAQFDALDSDMHRKALLEALRARDVYRNLVEELRAEVEKLKQGLVGPKRQRFKVDDKQLSIKVLESLLEARDSGEIERDGSSEDGNSSSSDGSNAEDSKRGSSGRSANQSSHGRNRKPTGRNAAQDNLQKIRIEILPDEVKRLGTDAFERIGEACSTTIERRKSALVEVTIVRPKFRAKTTDAEEAIETERTRSGIVSNVSPVSWITIAPPPELPIVRGNAGPGLLANVIVRRFDDHLPYNRLENVYEREGNRFGRSTLFGWLDALRCLFSPLIKAMFADARAAPYLCADATGVLVQAPEKCSRGHFWVLVVPGKHVLFSFSAKHDSAAVDELLKGYRGHLVADAHTVYDHLYGDGGATEVACWSHARTYFFKVLGSEPEIATEVLCNLRPMFLLEREFATKTRKQRERMRAAKVAPIVKRHFELCRQYEGRALEQTPLSAAIRYSLNQEQALERFVQDGRLPATNNISERQLRRQAIGRKNWLFVGSDDGAEVNTFCASLVASCHMHDIEPESYLRDLLCLLPSWPTKRLIELAPCNWKQTREQSDTQERLATNVFRSAILELDRIHRPEA